MHVVNPKQKRKSVRTLLCLCLIFVSAIFSLPEYARTAFNPQINYQAKLNDSAGFSVVDGNYNMIFRLCANITCTGGSDPLWTETYDAGNKIAVTNGLFSQMLGSLTSLNTVDFNQTLYLEIQVGGTGIPAYEVLLPRKIIGAVPAAFESDKLDGYDTAETGNSAHVVVTDATGNLKISNAGVPNVPLNGTDAYIEGSLEIDGVTDHGSNVDFNNNEALEFRIENSAGAPAVCTSLLRGRQYYDTLNNKTNVCTETSSGIYAWIVLSQQRVTVAAPTINDDRSDGYNTGTTWINTTDDTAYILLDDTTGAAIWHQIDLSSGGGSNPVSSFYAYDTAGAINISAGWTNITLDTEVREDADYTHGVDASSITINTAGWYKISYYITTEQTTGAATAQNQSQAKLQEDTGGGFVDIPGSFSSMATRGSGTVGETSSAAIILRSFDAGDIIKLQARRSSGVNTILTLPNGVGVTIEAVDGIADLDSAYLNDSDKKINVNNVAGLEFESSTTGNIVFDLQSIGDFVVQNAGSTALILDDSGNLGVGLAASTGRFEVTVSNTENLPGIVINQNDTTNNPFGIRINNAGTGNSISDDSGALLTAAGVWTDTSDRTKKENILGLPYGLSEIMQLNPVSYTWKSTGQSDIGFIAQDVKTILPELVYGDDGNMSLSYSHLTSVLTRAIQQQQLQIEALGGLDQIKDTHSDKGKDKELEIRIANLEKTNQEIIRKNSGIFAYWNYKIWTFVEDVIFKKRVFFEKHVTFNKDAAGYAEIMPGDTEVFIIFKEKYDSTPIITATPINNSIVNFSVTTISKEGFAIQIDNELDEAVQFNWHVTSIENPVTYVSDGGEFQTEVVETETVQPEIVEQSPALSEEGLSEEEIKILPHEEMESVQTDDLIADDYIVTDVDSEVFDSTQIQEIPITETVDNEAE